MERYGFRTPQTVKLYYLERMQTGKLSVTEERHEIRCAYHSSSLKYL